MAVEFILRAVIAICLSSIVLATAKCLYNLFFHPLRRFPGPLAARATRLYNVYHKLAGTLPYHVKELHDKYGSVVRIAPDELSYNTTAAWQDICGHRSGNKTASFEKDPLWYMAPKGSKQAPSIVSARDDDHRRMRKLQSHAFSEKALQSQEPIMMKYVDLLIKKLRDQVREEKVRGVIDVAGWYKFTTFDVIGDLAFGRSFNCLDSGVTHSWIDFVFAGFKIGNMFQSMRYFPTILLDTMVLLVPKSMKEKRARQFRFASDTARQRMSEGVNRGDGREDFMSYILRANDEKGMTPAEIESAANIYILAGSETTASMLSGTTYHLLANPLALAKLVHEIRHTFSKESAINIATISQLAYLNAVLEEGLRVYPPAPSTLPRVVPAGGEFVCGEWLPGGTTVGINQWATNYSEHNFHKPESFCPERWLGDPRFDGDDKKAMQPFSYGPRNCIGKNLAYSEMRLILTRLLWNFDLELQQESRDWKERQKVYILWEKMPLMVKLRSARPI